MAITYNSLGSRITVTVEGTTVTAGFNTAVAVVGGYDSANASADVTAGEVTTVSGPTEARTQFGEDCELTNQIELLGGASQIYAVPVPETDETESFASTSSGTLSNVPLFDPDVHPDHDITAVDTGAGTDVTVETVHVDGEPTAPTEDSTIVLDLVTGQWVADGSASYDITYTHGDYESAIDTAVRQPVRFVQVCTEDDGLKGYLDQRLTSEADNGSYKRGVVGSRVGIESGTISNYTPNTQSLRIIEVAPARGTSVSGTVRTLGAVTSLLATQPLDSGGSVTYDSVSGLEALNVAYSPNEAKQFEQVTALTRDGEIAEGVTTSDKARVRDIFKAEMLDLVIETYFGTIKNFSGNPAVSVERALGSALRRISNSFASQRPPVLATGEGGRPYQIDVGRGASDDIISVTAGVELADVAKEINLSLNVGEVNTVEIEA